MYEEAFNFLPDATGTSCWAAAWPPPPPAPGNDLQVPPPPPPASPLKHIKAMQSLGGIFYYQGEEVSFEKAVELINTNSKLNIQTPYPYSSPPKTFITKL